MSVIELYRAEDGRWHWAFRDHDGARALPSNEDYGDAAAARAAAEAAYPGVPVEEHGGPPSPAERRRRAAAGGLARKVAGWLTPVVILIAWSRARRR